MMMMTDITNINPLNDVQMYIYLFTSVTKMTFDLQSEFRLVQQQ